MHTRRDGVCLCMLCLHASACEKVRRPPTQLRHNTTHGKKNNTVVAPQHAISLSIIRFPFPYVRCGCYFFVFQSLPVCRPMAHRSRKKIVNVREFSRWFGCVRWGFFLQTTLMPTAFGDARKCTFDFPRYQRGSTLTDDDDWFWRTCLDTGTHTDSDTEPARDSQPCVITTGRCTRHEKLGDTEYTTTVGDALECCASDGFAVRCALRRAERTCVPHSRCVC